MAAIVARDHHERRNGSGYPRGILLNDMLVELVIAADIFDALISPRPYRTTCFDKRTALEEITKMAEDGLIHWDVVRALVNQNRKDRKPINECVVSLEKRGKPPENNFYGITVEIKNPGKKC
jgi:HD-GYP domain-containing protein (c-di-GMP phosphodiesterase class II)